MLFKSVTKNKSIKKFLTSIFLKTITVSINAVCGENTHVLVPCEINYLTIYKACCFFSEEYD